MLTLNSTALEALIDDLHAIQVDNLTTKDAETLIKATDTLAMLLEGVDEAPERDQ